ncbi:MAG: YcgL domain-containing protein [Pseudomonadales bacterium]|nr:YcgL domain-containing protein [Pseudomonadales bacterium]
MSRILCDVYKSSIKADLYIYVNRAEGLDRVPEALLKQFGSPALALTFELHAERRMAREDPAVVMQNLAAHGYHLQLPPADTWHG